MTIKAKRSIKEALRHKTLKGSDRECEYYPCHFEGQDCTWCFCPFYPCVDEKTGGYYLKKKDGEIWDCKKCNLIHKRSIAKKALDALSKRSKNAKSLKKKDLKEVFDEKVIRNADAKAKTLMVQGTASHTGKSLVVALICRILSSKGSSVAPFKAQNMSLNSYVTRNGREIARSQAFQALASGLDPVSEMNPILLKPIGKRVSQVILMGKPYRDMDINEYYRNFALTTGLSHIEAALQRLRELYDFVVIEGAGSPAEINLEEVEIANMRVADMADAPVILVGDIDKGGVFASITGTIALLKHKHKERIKGVIINKFRGDESILAPGIKAVERLTEKPVLGVLPYIEDLIIPQEDSVSLLDLHQEMGATDVAVIKLPRISNFTDFEPLTLSGLSIRYVSRQQDLGAPDTIIIPGTKSTVEDLFWLRETGLEETIIEAAKKGTPIIGVCGGFQIIGKRIVDEKGVETPYNVEVEGLGLLDVSTRFREYKKTTKRVEVEVIGDGPILEQVKNRRVGGYEIHMGDTYLNEGANPLFRVVDEQLSRTDGAIDRSGLIFGTYLHGMFDQPPIREALAEYLFNKKGLKKPQRPVSHYRKAWIDSLDKLLETFNAKLNVPSILSIIEAG